VKRLAKDVDELVTELGFSKTSIVAHDWGGIAAWEFAHEYPERIGKVSNWWTLYYVVNITIVYCAVSRSLL
jgi:hypothetical protein